MVTFIIPTMSKTKKYLDFCVKSIKENTKVKYEILIGENGDGTGYPQGQWGAVNRLVPKAKYDWIFLLNDDMYVPKGWDKDLLFPCYCFSPQTQWLSEPVPGLNYATLDAGTTIEDFDKDRVDEFMMNNEDRMVENGFHFPIIFNKAIWSHVEGFDEMYDPWGSNGDSDFEYKLWLAGVQPKFYHGIFVYHFGSKTESFSADKQNYWQKNWDYFIEKWGFAREETPWVQRADLHIPLEKLKYLPEWRWYK
jgi:glycosyltransferase involved in cell wall biosynthesis